MERPLVISFGIAAVIVFLVVAGVVYVQRGHHLELEGKILKVRTAPIEDNSSVAVVDFRITNPANEEFNVFQVAVIAVDPSGAESEGMTVSEIDAERLFQAIPLLGQKYNPSLILRTKVPPHATEDRMIAARFEMPEDKLGKRKQLTLRITEFEGGVSEIREK